MDCRYLISITFYTLVVCSNITGARGFEFEVPVAWPVLSRWYMCLLCVVTDWSEEDEAAADSSDDNSEDNNDNEVDHRPPAGAAARAAGDGMSSGAESDCLLWTATAL